MSRAGGLSPVAGCVALMIRRPRRPAPASSAKRALARSSPSMPLTMALTRLSSRASICEFSERTRQPPRVRVGSSTTLQARSWPVLGESLGDCRRILGMQVHAHVARRRGQPAHGLADQRGDLSRVGLQLAACELLAHRQRQQYQLLFNFALQRRQRPRQLVEDPVQARDLRRERVVLALAVRRVRR